jgi:phosphatidylglycerol---prolipoprotein diacylglyceryl transferase
MTFTYWWQHLPENLSPVLFEIGPLSLRYYGMMYIVAFATVFFMVRYRLRTENRFQIGKQQVGDLITAMIVGLILGARLGYVAFYNLSYYLSHPLEILLPFEFSNGIRFIGIAGMSYHGGLIGVILATLWYCRKNHISFWEITDLFIPVIPLGYTFGRLGNFINAELYGRITQSPIGMLFPGAPGDALRHPTQLYEAFFEGIFLFILLWSIRKLKWPAGGLFGIYLAGYGGVRFFIEFFREPDAHIGFVFLSLTMGQLLCAAMIVGGAVLYGYRAKHV